MEEIEASDDEALHVVSDVSLGDEELDIPFVVNALVIHASV